jgi:hypothetical protein
MHLQESADRARAASRGRPLGGWRAALFGLFAAAASGCVEATVAWTNLSPDGPPADPALEFASAAQWEAEGAPAARAVLQSSVYGAMPEPSAARVIERRLLSENAFGGKARLEEFRIGAAAVHNGVAVETRSRDGAEGFIMDVALPKDGAGPVPVILMETFCPRWSTLPDPALAPPADYQGPGSGGVLGKIERYVFGRYICTPPVEAILDAGYAIATIFPGEFIPDRREEGRAELKRLAAGHPHEATRWGAIAAWAWAYSRMVDVLEGDPRFDRDAMIAWGHSRYAKSALVAAAFDSRIDGVIAHQSGTGGASLNQHKKGESVAAITSSYPHWFARAYREDALEGFDQHQLLALIAPRPVLLGNARRDVWSDPNGAFRAAMGADPIYELYGARGLDQPALRPYQPEAELAFWIRPGTHGIVKEDWPAFLDFLRAHFPRKESDAGGGIVSSGRR